MNEIPVNCDILLNSDNDGIIKELLAQNRKNYNAFWGSEYVIMNEKSFIDSNFDAIIELMVKSRSILKPA